MDPIPGARGRSTNIDRNITVPVPARANGGVLLYTVVPVRGSGTVPDNVQIIIPYHTGTTGTRGTGILSTCTRSVLVLYSSVYVHL